jgi:pimeloyl-ACP methyl ester carboxylesterase
LTLCSLALTIVISESSDTIEVASMATQHEQVTQGTDRFVATNGMQLHLVDYASDGPPLVLMPGLTGNAHFFDAMVADGLSSGFRVLALDLRGRGLSDKPETGYTMANHAADMVGLLDTLGLERVLLGGHSFGGLVACYVAAHFPERVERCVVLDSPSPVTVRRPRRWSNRLARRLLGSTRPLHLGMPT